MPEEPTVNIHEYQAKELLRSFGLPVLKGRLATSKIDAEAAALSLGGKVVVVKAQIHAGGRGKAGGVKLARSAEEASAHAEGMLGKELRTAQTGAQGRMVRRVYVEEGCDIARELYLAFTLDREKGRVVLIASTHGGMDIEEVAATRPGEIHRIHVDPFVGLWPSQARGLAVELGLHGKTIEAFTRYAVGLYKAYVDMDASLVEVNPLVVTRDGAVVALDAKVSFDDNALFRREALAELRDVNEEDPRETEAAAHGLSYVALDGNIGCLVNGAGLAMATMDAIQLAGGMPANFLDVGGGADEERVAAAFTILLADPEVKALLVNIFGGIMRCDVIARGIIAAAKKVHLAVPLVVRLAGTNVELGKELLAGSGLSIIPADDLGDAAAKAVAAAGVVATLRRAS
jgi:succinyl-CoA synthetase beta subunit